MLRMAVAVRSTRLKTRSGSAVVTGNVHPTHTANPIEPIFGTEVTLDNRDS